MIRKAMRQDLLTHDDIIAQLRIQGLKRIEDVKEAYVDPSGEITVLPRNGASTGE